MAQVRKLSPEQLQEEFDKIQRAIAFIRGFKRDGSPMTSASSKKLKTGDVEVNVEAPSHGVPHEEKGATPSPNVSREEVAAPSHSQDIPEAQVKKGVHTSQSTIPIEEEDPKAEHKVCIKYASDADYASDDDTPVNLYAVVDWELLPMGLGSINAIYRLDNSRKYFTSLREILHLVTRADLMIIYGRVMKFYQDKKAAGVGLVLWGDLKVLMDSPEVNDGSDVCKNQHTWRIQSWKLYSFSGVHVLETVSGLVLHMFVDKKYSLSVNLIERMLDRQLEICHGTVGNDLTTAVQLIAFLKKQISDSKRLTVHECAHKVLLMEIVFGMLLGVIAMSFEQTKQFSGIGCWLTTTQQMVFNSPCLTDKKELIHHEVEMVITPPWIMTLLGTEGLASPNANGVCLLLVQDFLLLLQRCCLLMFKFNKTFDGRFQGYEANLLDTRSAQCSVIILISLLKVFVCRIKDMCRSFMCSSQDSSRLDVAVKFIFQSSRYVVPTGRVVVPTGRYKVPAGKVIIIVSTGRLSLVPTGRVLSPGRVK
ncbi:hypothetical protein Tco_1262787 [Tanacetum coccineum]